MWMVRDTSCQKTAPIIEDGWSEGHQQVFGKYGFDHVMDCGALGVGRRAHDSPLYRVKRLPNGWHGWCIDIKYLVDSWGNCAKGSGKAWAIHEMGV